MLIARRSFLRGLGAAALVGAVPTALMSSRPAAAAAGFGPLVPDPMGIFDLPAGFSYRVLERSGEDMDDGYRMPGLPDAMACFPGPAGTLILMRNHEVNIGDTARGPYKPGQLPPPEAYDPLGMGGVSRVVVDAQTFARRSSNMVLCGSARNCAGGPSPWGWITCEETVDPGHGYAFVCPIDAASVQPAQRIPGYGRFYHEAAAVDPRTNIAYLTEDRDDGCLYRFVPARPDQPFVGQLQAMKVKGVDRYDTATQAVAGKALELEWVPVMDPDPADDSMRGKAHQLGAAVIRRGEGIWYSGGSVYICSTSGGPVGGGQIFRHDPMPGDGRLTLVVQSEDRNRLDMPDNITVAPWGDILMCEDGAGDQYLRGLTPTGEIYELGRNALSTSEIAGVCVSPDGRAVFVNIQRQGLTLVITGPFPGTFSRRGVDVLPLAETGGCSTAPGGGRATGPAAVGAAALLTGSLLLRGRGSEST